MFRPSGGHLDHDAEMAHDALDLPRTRQTTDGTDLVLRTSNIELGREFVQAWQQNMRKQVMNEECGAFFSDIDFDELRMRALYDADGPVWQLAHPRDHAGTETTLSFKCSIPLATGAQCQFSSATMRGLISHKVRAHGFHEPVQRAVITNECPWCRSIFSKRLDAQHHACSSVLHGFCRAGGSHVQTETRQPQLLVECPLCKKIAAVECHDSESQPPPHVRAIRVEVFILI